MILLLMTMTGAGFLVWIYARWLQVKNFWAKRGIPYQPPHPIYGNLTFLQQMNPAIWMRQIYDNFQTKYVGIWLFWRPALVVNCPEIGHNILVKDWTNFKNRFSSSASHDTVGSLNLFLIKDPLWSDVRRRISPVFTSSKLKAVQCLMNEKSKELVQRIAMESKRGKFCYRTAYNDYTSDVIGTASFGVKSYATLNGYSPIRTVTKDFERYSLLRGIAWCCIFFFPELVGPLRFRVFPKNATDYFRKVYYIMVEQRQKEVKYNSEPRDLLDILLKMKKEMILDNNEVSDELLISQGATFLQAGFDTSGSQLTFLTYELAHNPEAQKKLYNELKDAKIKNRSADFDETALANLTYLNCTIKESIRKYQPMGWLDRKCINDYKIDDNLTIPAGTPVYVNAIGMHYDPNYFPEPTKFNPDRFLPENECNIQKYTFLPFGEGPRKCIGLRFAYMTVRTALAAIVLNYELRPVPNTPKPTEIQIEKNGLFLAPGETMYVDFVQRS